MDRDSLDQVSLDLKLLLNDMIQRGEQESSQVLSLLIERVDRLVWVREVTAEVFVQSVNSRRERTAIPVKARDPEKTALTASEVRDRALPLEAAFQNQEAYYVYLLWGDDDQTPIYVGSSRQVLTRIGAHMTDVSKRSLTRRVEIIPAENKARAEDMEMDLIQHYQPLFNQHGINLHQRPAG